MATESSFLCFLLLLVTQETHGIPTCSNPNEEYRNKGTIVNPECMKGVIKENKTCYLGCKTCGFMVLQCNEYGHWDELDYCQKVSTDCPIMDVTNANETVRMSDGGIGKTVEFICREDFVLKGQQKITCQRNYTWDYREPICESRRYTHEVIKAMDTLFFLKINDNKKGGIDAILLLDVFHDTFIRKRVDLMKALLLRCEDRYRGILYTLITYENKGYEICQDCNGTKTIQELDKVAKSQHNNTGSNLGSGLSRIFTSLLMMDRKSSQRDRILLLVTGHNPSISHNHLLWTKMLREDADFKIFVVALGDLVNKDEFRLMTNQPWQDYFFYLKYSQIHEAVGNLTNNESRTESGIVHTTSQLVHQIKINLKAENVLRLLLYVEATNHNETFKLMKQVAQNMTHGIHQPGLTIALNVDSGTMFSPVDTAVENLKVIQAEKLMTFDTLYDNLIKNKLYQKLQIIMFLSSSASSFNIRSVNDLKDVGCVMYAVGVGEQPRMENMQELVSFPWYLHMARA